MGNQKQGSRTSTIAGPDPKKFCIPHCVCTVNFLYEWGFQAGALHPSGKAGPVWGGSKWPSMGQPWELRSREHGDIGRMGDGLIHVHF